MNDGANEKSESKPFLHIVVDENGVSVLGDSGAVWYPHRWLIRLGTKEGGIVELRNDK